MVCGFSKEVFVMRKRLLAALLSAVLLLTLVPAAFAASDLDGHWAKKYIDYLADEDIINPSATTGKYQPDTKVTRAEFMRYINRAFHFTETASISYTDVPKSAWYYETVCIAQKYGYINGVGGGRMDPTGTVTREQAATIIGRLYKADPGNVSPSSLDFKDKAKISSWSAGYIRAAVDKGFLAGYSDGTFRPTREVTRGEVAKIIYSITSEPRFREPERPIRAPTCAGIRRTLPFRRAVRCPMRRSRAICSSRRASVRTR